MTRAEREREIAGDASAVDDVVELIRSRTAFVRWPDTLQAAFALALVEGLSESSAWQVVVLRRHLFGPRASFGPVGGRSGTSRLADRLRSELPERLSLRSGCYLLEPDTVDAIRLMSDLQRILP